MKKILKTAIACYITLMMSNQIAEAQKIKSEVRNGKNYIVHKVQKGETFYSLAKEYKTNPKSIQSANPNTAVLKTDILVYVPTEEDDNTPDEKSPVLKTKNQTHLVQKSETLSSIAKKYQISVEDLKEANDLKGDKIGPGQELLISTSKRRKDGKLSETKGQQTVTKNTPKNELVAKNTKKPLKATETEKQATEEYQIKKGETLFSIAKQHNVKTEDILALNEDLEEDRIAEGKSILVPVINNDKKVKTPEKIKKEEEKKEEAPEKIKTNELTPLPGGNPFGDAPITEEYALNKAKNKPTKEVKAEEKKVVKDVPKKIVEKKELPNNGEEPIYHTIRANESFETIRTTYNVSRTELKYWNDYEWDNNKLKIGQQILVYKPTLVSYAAKAGEKMKDIAKKHQVSTRQIEIWNNLQHEQAALVGKVYTIYQPTGPQPDADYLKRKREIEERLHEAASNPTNTKKLGTTDVVKEENVLVEHLVEKQQGLFSIAKKYKVSPDDVKKWNNLSDDGIKIGQKLKIYTAVAVEKKTTDIIKKEEPKQNTKTEVKKDLPIVNNGSELKPIIDSKEDKKEDKIETDAFVKNEEKPILRGGNLPTKDNETAIVNQGFGGNNKVITPTDLNTILQTGYAQVIPDIPSPRNQAALHRDIEPGTTLVVKNMQNGRITMVEVAAKLNPANIAEDVILQVSPSVYQKLGIDGTEKVEVEISYVKKAK